MRARSVALTLLTLGAITAATFVMLTVVLPKYPQWRDIAFWQNQSSPGMLSAAHRFLERDCGACHTPLRGVEAPKCIICHANNQSLLKRQATAFHADIGACAECHREHEGSTTIATAMDHRALATIAQRRIGESNQVNDVGSPLYRDLVKWTNSLDGTATRSPDNPHLTPSEMTLDCKTCHATKDPHLGLFGQDCAQCHATTQWTLPEFRHPSPRSLDCAQCHQAPPSHYMEHFKMISMRIAGERTARVNQCYLCHQTTAWNDIRSVGYYKHH